MKNKVRKELNKIRRYISFELRDLGKYYRFIIVDHGLSVNVQMNRP